MTSNEVEVQALKEQLRVLRLEARQWLDESRQIVQSCGSKAEFYVANSAEEKTLYFTQPKFMLSIVYTNYGPVEDRTAHLAIPTSIPKYPAELHPPIDFIIRDGTLLVFYSSITRLFDDAPLYFEDAIKKLRAFLASKCIRTNHENCKHAAKTLFLLSPDDKCFARYFSSAQQPPRQWDTIALCFHETQETPHVWSIKFTNDRRNDRCACKSCDKPLSIASVHRIYDLYCDSQAEFLVIQSKPLLDGHSWNFDEMRPWDLLPCWKIVSTATVSSTEDNNVYNFRVFRGPLATLHKDALNIKNIPVVKKLILPPGPTFEFLSTDVLNESEYRLFGNCMQEEVVAPNLRELQNPHHWNHVHPILLGIAIAMAPLELSTYVLLWIIDFLPEFLHSRCIRKIRLIEGVVRSRRSIFEARDKKRDSKNKKIE